MNYKKKYEEAERLYQTANADQRYVLESLFPKLRESEDERIRQKFIKLVKMSSEVGGFALHKWEADEMLAWLERQGEQNDDNIVEKAKTEKQRVIITETDGNANIDWDTRSLEDARKLLECGLQYINTELEKQGGQNDSDVKDYNSIDPHFAKPIDMVEPKFKVGDWVVWDNKISCHIDNIYQGKESLMYTITDDHNMTRSYSVKGFDNNAHLWTINDARDGDVLVDKWGNIGIYQGDTNAITWHSCCYCGVNKMFYDEGWHEFPCYPATKEQRDTLMKAMADAGWEFDFEKKELKKIEDEEYNSEDYGIDGLWHAKNILEETLGKVDGYQSDDGILEHKAAITAVKKLYKQKPAWTEEDEKMCQETIDWFEKKCFPYALENDNPARESIKWLKSLKQRAMEE